MSGSALKTVVQDWLDTGLGFLYPNICQICGAKPATAREGYICPECWCRPSGVCFIKPPFCELCGLPYQGDITTTFECSNCREMDLHFKSARAAVAATSLILDVIHRYKYKRALWFEPFLVDLFLRQAAPQLRPAEWDLLVPVPLHPLKRREREFNQAERLAGHLSAATGIPIQTGLLKRLEPTKTQTLLTRSERAANVKNAFATQDGQHLDGERVVLIDDVLTTGATTSSCAKVLRDNGSGEVSVWTVARGL